VTHLHIVPVITGAVTAGLTTRIALIPFDSLRAHYFDAIEQNSSVHKSLRSRFTLPSSLSLVQSIFKTAPSAVGLLAFDFALAREAREEALRTTPPD
jgi:hypothetical protein